MWKYKLGLGVSDQFELTTERQIELFAKIGFDAFFTGWSKGAPISEWRRIADSVGIEYQSIHSPFGRSVDMWKGGEAADAAVSELIECARDCADSNVPIMIAHAFIGFKDHEPTEYGIESYGKVADECRRLGVRLALENTEGEEYLAALMKAFDGESHVGFCFDSGHEMCYNHSKDMLALYGDRLIATHLNDNLGVRRYDGEINGLDDLHLLPFDGVADWNGIAARLNRVGYDGIMTFEMNRFSKPDRHDNDIYAHMPPEAYLIEVYKRACHVAYLRGI